MLKQADTTGVQSREWGVGPGVGRADVVLLTQRPCLTMPPYSPRLKMPPASSCHRASGCSLHEGPSGPVSLWGDARSSANPQL